MSKHQPRPEKAGEPQARAVVHTILGAQVCRTDTGTQNSQVDAAIHPTGRALDDGFPLEVVRITNPKRRRQVDAMTKTPELHIAGLRHGYTVALHDPALRIRGQQWLTDYLHRLEDDQRAPATHRPPVSPHTCKVDISPHDGLDPGQVVLMVIGPHHSPWEPLPGMYAQMLEEQFATGHLDDVVDKLARHGGEQRHAFLWVDATEHDAVPLLRRLQPGDLDHERDPELPPAITHVWLALAGHEGAAIVLWGRQQGWQVHRPDEIRPAEAFECPVHGRTWE